MPAKGISTSFVHHTTIAAATLKEFSEIHSTPYLKVVAGVALLILETVQVRLFADVFCVNRSEVCN
jgi:hypothetical protein